MINILTAIIALQHLGFLILEMFLWNHPIGLKVFRNTPEAAKIMAPLAANMGLYNGFLVAGLIWSLFAPELYSEKLKLFFLSCVLVAGLFAWLTVNIRIFFIQGLPALIALTLILLGHYQK